MDGQPGVAMAKWAYVRVTLNDIAALLAHLLSGHTIIYCIQYTISVTKPSQLMFSYYPLLCQRYFMVS